MTEAGRNNSNTTGIPAQCTAVTCALRAGLLLPLLLAAACNTSTVKNENTLTQLEQMDISVQDEKIEDSLHKAMESYREYIKTAPVSTIKPEAIHRLADLEVEESYRIEGVQAPAEPGARSAIDHYTRLLAAYPLYDRNDRALYQLSRAYEEAGENSNAVNTLEKLVADYPGFERMDEVKFRLGEHYFRERKYLNASKAYAAVITSGETSTFYESALKKQGWTYFKQDKYSQALSYFIAVLDYKIEQGFSPDRSINSADNRELDETYRAISLSFAYLGGTDAIEAYMKKRGNRDYEREFYRQLADYYLSKERYTDAARTMQAYIDKYPYSEISPAYSIRIIEIYNSGGFYDLALDARKNFNVKFTSQADYWKKLNPEEHANAIEYQKSNIRTLASIYHARYQKLPQGKKKQDSYSQAIHWYREYYYLYPLDQHAPQMSKLLAELYLENGDYRAAAVEFERIAKNDPAADIAAESAYAALFAHRESLKSIPESRRRSQRGHITDKSLWFAEHYPQHAETASVLTAAAYDYLVLKHFDDATMTAQRVINNYPDSAAAHIYSARIVLADAAFESGRYAQAEQAYSRLLETTETDAEKRAALTENLAASIYKQAEQSKKKGDHGTAAQHFLRLQALAPGASLSATAQYEAASSLVTIGEWTRAAVVLEDFQKQNPTHELAEATTRNLAAIYKQNDELLKSAGKLELVAKNDPDEAIRRDALLQAAELYSLAKRQDDALRVYKQYTQTYPSPVEDAVESYRMIADIYKSKNDINNYQLYLNRLISADAKAGRKRTDRTRYLAAQSLLVLAEFQVDEFSAVELTRPFKRKLEQKKKKMALALGSLTRLLEYQVSETTTAATYYIAEIYLQFSQALAKSERPTTLNELELEQYELALEEQSYMFEEKAISVYQKNTELLDAGIHDPWVDRSIARLSTLFPAQYAKQEQQSGYLKDIYAADDRS
jgi:tetratricopeptide (TPR) repeat protein